MQKNLFTILSEELIKHKLFIIEKEGEILKTEITQAAINLDPKLIKILLQNKALKKHFFTDVEGIIVFDKEKFTPIVTFDGDTDTPELTSTLPA